MTREVFLKIIDNTEDQDRVMAMVDRGIKISGSEDNLIKQEEWYDYCAKVYNECCIPIIDKNKISQEDYVKLTENNSDRIKLLDEKLFSFPHFSARLSEIFDNYMYRKYVFSQEDKRLQKLQQIYVNFDQVVDEFFKHNNDGTFTNDLILDIKTALHKSYTINELTNDEQIKELNDAKALMELSAISDLNCFKIQTIQNGTFNISSQRALDLLHNLILPYFQDRFVSKIKTNSIDKEITRCKILKNKHTHVVVRELYKAFAKHGKVKYENIENTYHSSEKNGKYASLSGEISFLIFELLVDLDLGDKRIDEALLRKEKIDVIKNCMRADIES